MGRYKPAFAAEGLLLRALDDLPPTPTMRHFEEELDNLRNHLLEMSGLVEDSVYRSIQSLIEKDEVAAQQVLQNEARINRMEIEIDEVATSLLARVQPMATDLRFITAAIKINNDLERMGDISVNIVRRTLALMREPIVEGTGRYSSHGDPRPVDDSEEPGRVCEERRRTRAGHPHLR